MRANLLTFLFGESVVQESSQKLGEEVLKLFEEAADEETEEMVTDKQPLSTALKSLDIDGKVEAGPSCAELTCDNADDYAKYVGILFDPENMHALATKGWVPVKTGDIAMSFEPAVFKIGFIEIATADLSTTDKAPDLEKVSKDAQKFASTEVDHDDDNPVEFDDKTSDDNQKGIGKPSDGKDPEGKPKGAKKTSESRRGRTPKQVAESLLEMTGTGAIPTNDGPPPVPATKKIDWGQRLAAMQKRRGDRRNVKRA